MNNSKDVDRREMLKGLSVTLLASTVLPACATSNQKNITKSAKDDFSFCLNTSTIMGQKVGLMKELEIAAEAGYDGIEIWIPTLDTYLKEGGSLRDLNKRIKDLGIRIENAIGFAQWIVNDPEKRKEALEQAKKEMNQLAQLGCKRLAAPPAGAQKDMKINLDDAAERFASLVDVGNQTGVNPQLEVWGFSENLSKLSEVLYVAAECGQPNTRILPDVYHLFKGGSDFDGLKLISGDTIEIFHMNDYPSTLSREEIGDKDRVYPGLGVGPIAQVLTDLKKAGGPTVLSLELFNRDYWAQDPLEVAKSGLISMKEAVAKV